MQKSAVVGVLAIQGDFQAHLDVLSSLAFEAREVRNPLDLQKVSHLIIPGGESTTIRKVAMQNGLWEPLKTFAGPVLGTCMGSIMMARKIITPDSDGWGMIDMTIKRNAYGRQINSFTAFGRLSFLDSPFEMVFIRAPKIAQSGSNVEAIAWLGDEVTGVRSGNKVALTFHPELSGSNALHKYFLELK
jgi:pyridoxal 5'-phosphate synthase pdxT subunit